MPVATAMPLEALKPNGLSGTSALRLFMEFPGPLALLHPDGHVELSNARLDALLDKAVLDTVEIRTVAMNPGQPPRPVSLRGRDGRLRALTAQAMRISQRVILSIGAVTDPLPSAELETLQARIVELEQLSATDHLTGAWNRSHLDRTVESELSRSVRYKQPVSLILIDIDHFKLVNDTRGHDAGDVVLRELVATVTAHIRSADLLFRWGGEEFVVLASASGYRAAERVAEHLRDAIRQAEFPPVGHITVSIGVAEHCDNESSEQWFKRLDVALYAAKHDGRDRIVVDRRGMSDRWQGPGRSPLRLEWREAYESGHPLIDSEHQMLFEHANALIDALAEGAEWSVRIAPAMDRLLAHVAQHFADEEAILDAHHYERLASHRAAHAALLAHAAALRKKAGEDALRLGELVEYLAEDVVARHLLAVDRDFFPLFRHEA